LDDIAGAATNPKGHDLAGIQTSIARFGFVSPAVVDERTGRLVAGHGRILALQAMRDAGQTPPAGVHLDDGGRWLVPLLTGWASRSDAEADAYLVADNEWTLRGGWDEAELGDFLAALAGSDPDLLAVTGFTEHDVADLLDIHHPADLDELGATYGGAGSPGELWPAISVKVPHRVRAAYTTLTNALEGADHEKMTAIIYAAAPPLGVELPPLDGPADEDDT
jgi:hypothetical protein